jgi:hypothetical protein
MDIPLRREGMCAVERCDAVGFALIGGSVDAACDMAGISR